MARNPLAVVVCRVCGRPVVVECGTVRIHQVRGDEGLLPCPGSGQKVAPATNEGNRARGQLTAAQKDELLCAYRDTFESERHGDAVKAMYESFSERYDIDPGVLRAAINKDLESNPQRYAQLRQKLHGQKGVKRKSAANATQAVRNPTRAKKTVTCPVCDQAVAGQNREPADHEYDGRPCSGEVSTCKVCKRKLPVRASDGRMTSHSAGGKTCAGSGRSPYEGRSPKFMQGITRVVSGGLSSTRRRH